MRRSSRGRGHPCIASSCMAMPCRLLSMIRCRLVPQHIFFIILWGGFLCIDAFLPKQRCWCGHLASRLNVATGPNGDIAQQRPRQTRKRSRNRHPSGYWQDLGNVKMELYHFWNTLGLTLPATEPPLIPSEALLNHFERNDLRYAIFSHGGRYSLSERLGGARVMPGKWTVAVQQSPELQALLRNEAHGLSPKWPPLSPQQKKQTGDEKQRNKGRWAHSPARKPPGYWSMETILKELYCYLDDYQECMNRPSIWMPRLAELQHEGRDDLKQAITRFGGIGRIRHLAGLVSFREWFYFEGQYELLVNLRDYLDRYHDSDRAAFPCATDVKRHGYQRLYSLIQFYGGSKFLANRLSMTYIHANAAQDDLNWGPFDLDTAIKLLRFVREDQMKLKGPLKRLVIAIPSERKLLANGEKKLHDQIMELGGYESVARRLGLAYFD